MWDSADRCEQLWHQSENRWSTVIPGAVRFREQLGLSWFLVWVRSCYSFTSVPQAFLDWALDSGMSDLLQRRAQWADTRTAWASVTPTLQEGCDLVYLHLLIGEVTGITLVVHEKLVNQTKHLNPFPQTVISCSIIDVIIVITPVKGFSGWL